MRNPYVAAFSEKVEDLIDEVRAHPEYPLNYAEVVGVLEMIKMRLFREAHEDAENN